MSGREDLMKRLISATVWVKLNLATMREPSERRSWIDVAGSDSLTPDQGVDADAAGLDAGCEALAEELEGPAEETDISSHSCQTCFELISKLKSGNESTSCLPSCIAAFANTHATQAADLHHLSAQNEHHLCNCIQGAHALTHTR